jgi:hypothetical protein
MVIFEITKLPNFNRRNSGWGKKLCGFLWQSGVAVDSQRQLFSWLHCYSGRPMSKLESTQTNSSEPARQRCRACRHYYITHDINFPYGCRQLGFKSAREPMRDVIESSGQVCLYFMPVDRSARA